MATLPYNLSAKTTLARQSAIRADRAVDGTMRYIDMGATTYSRLSCYVEALDADDRDTLVLFLDTNETSEIDVAINGVTYRGRLMPSVPVSWRKVSGRYEVAFDLWARPL